MLGGRIIAAAGITIILLSTYLTLMVKSSGSRTDQVIKLQVESNVSTSKGLPSTSVFFMKTHKTASSAIQNIFMRFAAKSGLTVATGEANDWSRLCYSRLFSRSCVADRTKLPYDFIIHHLRFNKPEINAAIKPGAKYISIVRDPNDLIQSAFTYFEWIKTLPEKSLTDFVQHYKDYQFDKEVGVPYRNLMMYDFGLEVIDFDNKHRIAAKLQEIEASFDLILVTEYMFPSLVLLKHLLNWTYDDVACLHINSQSDHTSKKLDIDGIRKLRKANTADQMLYDKFFLLFKKKVKLFGEDRMVEEVRILQQTVDQLKDRCLAGTDTSKWSTNVSITRYQLSTSGKADAECQSLVRDELNFTQLFRP